MTKECYTQRPVKNQNGIIETWVYSCPYRLRLNTCPSQNCHWCGAVVDSSQMFKEIP